MMIKVHVLIIGNGWSEGIGDTRGIFIKMTVDSGKLLSLLEKWLVIYQLT